MPRTPRNTLNPELIVEAAVRLMESTGADAFSLRALAGELRVGPMALYTYFRNKDELYDAVRNHLLALGPDTHPGGGPWQVRVRTVCRNLRKQMLRHPVLVQLLAARPLSGHETAAMAEGLLRVLRDAGFDAENAARAHTTLFTFVLGSTSWEIQMAAEKQDPERNRRLRNTMEALSPLDYPTVVALAPELSWTTGGDKQFDYGLDLLLTGLEQRLS